MNHLAVIAAFLLVVSACSKSEKAAETKTPTVETQAATAPEAKDVTENVEAPVAEAKAKTDDPKKATVDTKTTERAELPVIDIPNAHLFKGALTGGQPTDEQYKQAAEAGYKTVVNLRPTTEAGAANIEATVKALGMSYIHIPISNAADLTKENASLLAAALKADNNAIVHCKSGNRVGALFALKEHFVDGLSSDEALTQGKKAGLTRLEGKVQEIINSAK